jgi:aquaporin Z
LKSGFLSAKVNSGVFASCWGERRQWSTTRVTATNTPGLFLVWRSPQRLAKAPEPPPPSGALAFRITNEQTQSSHTYEKQTACGVLWHVLARLRRLWQRRSGSQIYHLNPAISVGLWVGRRFKSGELLPYIAAQVIGAVVGAWILSIIAGGQAGFTTAGGFAANGYGDHSPGKYTMLSGFVAEVVLTFFFLLIILGATDQRAPQGFAPIAIGLGLTLIHLIGIPVTNLSVNPARSTGPAMFVGGWALQQLWLFWVAPILGAILAGLVYPVMAGRGAGKDA